MKSLTIIIPFLNEGLEIENTVKSIRGTAGNEVDIFLINDHSQDGFDYESVASKYGTSYMKNEKRMGVAASRDIGIENIETDNFLIVDGHMRFFHNNWWKVISDEIKKNERVLYCCKCKPFNQKLEPIYGKSSFGAYINLSVDAGVNVLSAVWNRKDLESGCNRPVIPCVLGASYAASKGYWQYLKGLTGLRMYGSDEEYISIKVWLEGGECILLKEIEIGHIFRDEFPYPVQTVDRIFNKLFIAYTLFPIEYRNMVYNGLRQSGGIPFRDAMEIILEQQEEIKELSEYYQKISTRTFDSFIEFNTKVKNAQVFKDI